MRYQKGEEPVPGYKIDSFLGAGSYGEVWKVSGPGGVNCALKFIRLDSKSGLKELKSIGLVKRLQHPNLVPVQAIWLKDAAGNFMSDTESDSIRFNITSTKELIIAMGLGRMSLSQRLEECRVKGGLPDRELIRYMEDSAKGIDYLNEPIHELGSGPAAIIHCDIKPANLLIVGGGVQVCDYGVAKAIGQDYRKTLAAGTPAYAAPELINNEPGPKTDQYSLAISYFELRTGVLPFDEEKAIISNLTGLLDLSRLNKDEREVVRRATHMKPDKRYPTCLEMVEELKIASGVTFSVSRPVSVGETIRRAPAPPPEDYSPPKPLTERLQAGGELVPGYKLRRQIGRGGYGEVWEARGPGGMPCALKIVRDLRGRGRHEFQTLETIGWVDHQNLIRLQGSWVLAANGTVIPPESVGTPGSPTPTVLVMATQLAEKNLYQLFCEFQNRGLPGIPAVDLVSYMRQAADAVDHLNETHRIQHRDIKPENLLLIGQRLLVSDFGLAKLVEGDGAVQSSNSGMTPEYAAPEVLDRNLVTPRTDQYSLAVTYFFLRTGHLPFAANLSQREKIEARSREHYDLTGLSNAERGPLARALSADPDARFPTCRELVSALARGLGIEMPAAGSSSGAFAPLPDARGTGRDGESTAPYPAIVASPPGTGGRSDTFHQPRSTPRSKDTSKESDEVRLEPAAPARPTKAKRSGATIQFGNDSDDEDDAPPPPPKQKSVWDDEPSTTRKTKKLEVEGSKGKAGALMAMGIGVVAVLGILGGGGWYLMQPDPTITSGTGSPTSTASTSAITPATQKDNPPVKTDDEKAKDLEPNIRAKIEAKDWDGAITAIVDVRKLSPTRADALQSEVEAAKKRNLPPPPPETDTRLTKAREHFRARDLQKGLGVVREVLADKISDTVKTEATALDGQWTKALDAKTKQSPTLADLFDFHKEFARPTSFPSGFAKADEADLEAFYKSDLAARILAVIPLIGASGAGKLSQPMDWSRLFDLCLSADPTAGVKACLTECAAEIKLTGGKAREVDLPVDADVIGVQGDNLTGYGRYVIALRKLSNDPKANVAPDLADIAIKKDLPGWVTPTRAARLMKGIYDGAIGLKDAANYGYPYKPADAAKVYSWLTTAGQAAKKAGPIAKPSPGELAHETLLAGWSVPADAKEKPPEAELATLGTAVRPEIEKLLPSMADRGRFWTIFAMTRGETVRDQLDSVEGFSQLFALADKKDAGIPDEWVYRVAITYLLKGAIRVGLQKGTPADKLKGADVLVAAARNLRTNRAKWAVLPVIVEERKALAENKRDATYPIEMARKLYEQAAQLSGRPEDYAWAGICRSEGPNPDPKLLEDDAQKALKANGGTTAASSPHPLAKVLDGIAKRAKGLAELDPVERTKAFALAWQTLEPICKSWMTSSVGIDNLELAVPYAVDSVARLALDTPDELEKTNDSLVEQNKRDKVLQGLENFALALEKAAGKDATESTRLANLKAYTTGVAKEHRAWVMKPMARFTDPRGTSDPKAGLYSKADSLLSKTVFPIGRLARVRNLLRWADDLIEQQDRSMVNPGLINDVDADLKTLWDALESDSSATLSAECASLRLSALVLRHRMGGQGAEAAYQQAVATVKTAHQYVKLGRMSILSATIILDSIQLDLLEMERLADMGPMVRQLTDRINVEMNAAGDLLSREHKALIQIKIIRATEPLNSPKPKEFFTAIEQKISDGLAGPKRDGVTGSDRVDWANRIRLHFERARINTDEYTGGGEDGFIKASEDAVGIAAAHPDVGTVLRASAYGALGSAYTRSATAVRGKEPKTYKELSDKAQENLALAIYTRPDEQLTYTWRFYLGARCAFMAQDAELGMKQRVNAAVLHLASFRHADYSSQIAPSITKRGENNQVMGYRNSTGVKKVCNDSATLIRDALINPEFTSAVELPIWRLVLADWDKAAAGPNGNTSKEDREIAEFGKLTQELMSEKPRVEKLPSYLPGYRDAVRALLARSQTN